MRITQEKSKSKWAGEILQEYKWAKKKEEKKNLQKKKN